MCVCKVWTMIECRSGGIITTVTQLGAGCHGVSTVYPCRWWWLGDGAGAGGGGGEVGESIHGAHMWLGNRSTPLTSQYFRNALEFWLRGAGRWRVLLCGSVTGSGLREITCVEGVRESSHETNCRQSEQKKISQTIELEDDNLKCSSWAALTPDVSNKLLKVP